MISEKYRDLYISSTQEQLKELADFLLQIDKDAKNEIALTAIFRSLHSMKGAASTMGLKKTVDFLHNFESIIQAALDHKLFIDKKIIDIFFRKVDRLQTNLQAIGQGQAELDWRQDDGDLQKILKGPAKIKTQGKDKKKKTKDFPSLVSPHTTSELTVTADQLNQLQNTLDDLLVDIMAVKGSAIKHNQNNILPALLTADTLVNKLRRELERLRAVSLAQVFSTLPYLVRSIAKDEGKNVDLVIEDNNLSLDKSILDELLEIIIQLVKNSIVHGIAHGQKNGQVTVSVSLATDQIVVKVSDNGRGIDWRKVKELALRKKIISPILAKKLKPAEVLNLLFHTNMSSQRHLNINAGRGVGLSLVKDKVMELNGQILLSSTLHKGTVFTINLPLSLSIFRSLSWQLGDWVMAIPLSYIDRVVRLPEIKDFNDDKFFAQQRQRTKLFSLLKIFSVPGFKALAKYVLYLKTKDGRRALPVYGKIKESELVMKKTPTVLRKLSFVRGVAVSSAGRPVLILDVNNLI